MSTPDPDHEEPQEILLGTLEWPYEPQNVCGVICANPAPADLPPSAPQIWIHCPVLPAGRHAD